MNEHSCSPTRAPCRVSFPNPCVYHVLQGHGLDQKVRQQWNHVRCVVVIMHMHTHSNSQLIHHDIRRMSLFQRCPENTFNVRTGMTSPDSCLPCGDSATSTVGSFVCAGGTVSK